MWERLEKEISLSGHPFRAEGVSAGVGVEVNGRVRVPCFPPPCCLILRGALLPGYLLCLASPLQRLQQALLPVVGLHRAFLFLPFSWSTRAAASTLGSRPTGLVAETMARYPYILSALS